jgi:hypothetical protein
MLPHKTDCPAAPLVDDAIRLTLDKAEESAPFILTCPLNGCRFLQTQHTTRYDYTPTDGQTDQFDLPLVCPICGATDKQSMPTLVGYDPQGDDEAFVFTIECPAPLCGWKGDRTDGVLDIWLEKAIVVGVDELKHKGIWFKKGRAYAEYTELSIFCPDCGHACGEDPE